MASLPRPVQNQQATTDVLPVLPPVFSAAQYILIPRRAVLETSSSHQTANCAVIAEADDGLNYYLKEDRNNKPVRASEWIAAPSAMPIQRLDGTVVFGSRQLGGVAAETTTTAYLTRSTLTKSDASNLARLLSRIYVFDLMIFNEDRHIANYLTVEDNGKLFLYAFDYSHALFRTWPLNGFPGPGSRTRDVGKFLRGRHGFDLEAANELLTRLSMISPEQMRSFVDRMPSDWLPTSSREGLMRFWAGAERMDRVAAIRKGVSDGWLL